jgi:hypothetical protein
MKLTLLWQGQAYAERDWIREIFAPITGGEVHDGNHKLVLDDCLLIDSYVRTHPPGYYEQFRGRNAWLLHLSDETYEGGYNVYANFRGVFRNYWARAFVSRGVLPLPLGYSDGVAPGMTKPADGPRPYLWSFLGQSNKSSRPDMLRAFAPLTPSFVLCTDGPERRSYSRAEYQQVLLNSVFIPCPMGNVNLDSFRVYEALECGAIPILEKRLQLDYFRELLGEHPLPAFRNWSEAARFVASLRNNQQAISALRDRCFQWWMAYKRTLGQQIQDHLAHSQTPQMPRTLPTAQLVELMRHQSLRTLNRRVQLQFGRLLARTPLRKTYGAS